jgi:hypothetical protein
MKNKIIYLLAFVLLAAVSSCKKNDSASSASTATFSASVDGVATDFNIGTIATKTTANGITAIFISGKSSATQGLTISVAGPTLTPTTYTASGNQSFADMALGTTDGKTWNTDYSSTTNLVTVTVTSITAANIQGTFKGDLILSANSTGGAAAKRSITNGKFSLPVN